MSRYGHNCQPDEYARPRAPTKTFGLCIHTNTVEGYYSIFKRGMKGVYQHCSEKHLHRYLAEFDFRYSNRAALGANDLMRAEDRGDWYQGQAPYLSTASQSRSI